MEALCDDEMYGVLEYMTYEEKMKLLGLRNKWVSEMVMMGRGGGRGGGGGGMNLYCEEEGNNRILDEEGKGEFK